MTLPAPTPKVMFGLIQDMDAALPDSDDEEADQLHTDVDVEPIPSRNGAASQPRTLDQQLSFEAEMAKYKVLLVQRERDVTEIRVEKEEISEAYIRLQENYDSVKEQSARFEDQLKKMNSAQNGFDQLSLKDLDSKVAQQEDTIARYEAQITDQQSSESDLRRKLDKLSLQAEDFQKLQDDFQIQKVQLEQQTKKANAGEKYKQKIQASQAIERERDALRQQLEEARPRLRAYDDCRRNNVRLEKENHEIGSTLSRSERDNNELRETKQTVLIENSRLQRDTKSLREALAQSQDRIADLEEKAGGSEIHSSPTVVDGGLESELAETSKYEAQLQVAHNLILWIRLLTSHRKLRIAEVEKQNQQLTSHVNEKDSALTALQRQLDNAQDTCADQNAVASRLRNEISRLQLDIAQVRAGHPIKGSVSPAATVPDFAHIVKSTETFTKMREQLKAEQKLRADLEEELSTAQRNVEVANSDRMSSFERHCMLSDLNIDLLEVELAGKPKLDIVEEVKNRQSVATVQLENEVKSLEKRYNRLEQEFHQYSEENNQAQHKSHEDSTQTSQDNIQTMATKMEEFYASPLKNGREQLAKAQQVEKNLSFTMQAHSSQQLPPSKLSFMSRQTKRLRGWLFG